VNLGLIGAIIRKTGLSKSHATVPLMVQVLLGNEFDVNVGLKKKKRSPDENRCSVIKFNQEEFCCFDI